MTAPATARPAPPPDAWPPPAETTITVYLPREWKRRVKTHAASTGVTISAYALALIAKDLGL